MQQVVLDLGDDLHAYPMISEIEQWCIYQFGPEAVLFRHLSAHKTWHRLFGTANHFKFYHDEDALLFKLRWQQWI